MSSDAEYHLGEISERHEGAGPATISRGKGDHGGVSYARTSSPPNPERLTNISAPPLTRMNFVA